MESIKSFFRKKHHKYQDELMVSHHNDRESFRHNSFRQPFVPKNPYSVITEPKTKKATRSCPGGRSNNYPSRPNNTMYENLNNSNNFQRQKQLYAQQMIRQKPPIRELDEQRILTQNSFQTVQHSSEYGSADPSPTNPYSKNNESFDTSDSEAEDSIALYYKNLYEKKLRKLERKYRKADREARIIEENYYNLAYAFDNLKNQLNSCKVENDMLKAQVIELEKRQQSVVNEPIVYAGAPEAMCSISELTRNSIAYPSRNPPSYHDHSNNESDEVKIFETNEEFELPRTASNSLENPCSLSPNSRPPNPIALDDFLPLNAKLATDQDDKHLVHFKQTNDSSQSDEEDDQKTPTEVVAPILPHNHANMFYGAEHAPLLQIKRSYSDSDLRDLKLVVQEEENEELANKQTSRNRLKRASTRYSKADHSSSYSSDDDRIRDGIEMQTKQLKPRGNNHAVHYRPPRRTILNKGTNVYRRCGPNERKAIAEFDYLQDISTNSSGLE